MRTTWLILSWLALAGGLPTHAQPVDPASAAASRISNVLELDGTGSYVQLPDEIFHASTEGTVEAWVYANHWEDSQRFFSFGGYQNDMGVGRPWNARLGLQFFIGTVDTGTRLWVVGLRAPVPARKWLHLAAVSGPGGMELYLNGVLLGTNSFAGSFNSISGKQNFIGAWHTGDGTDLATFAGRIGEFRVWNIRRTAQQIREGMFQGLNGTEPGLAGLWNFAEVENGVVKDASPAAHHGKLIGDAKVITDRLPASAAPARISNVLDLDGTNSWVELPPNLFTNQLVTVEGWVKWREFGTYSRFFHFGDAALHIVVMNHSTTADLRFENFTRPPFDGLVNTTVPDALRQGEWQHIAVVAGTNLIRLYLNGVLIATNATRNSWRPNPPPPLKNFLGRSLMKDAINASDDTDLDGQMDEVRLWAGERSEAQIREAMFQALTGQESGLLALWNFENVTNGIVRDSCAGGRDGKLQGSARVVSAAISAPSEGDLPGLI